MSCRYDTDGDGDCPRCAGTGECLHPGTGDEEHFDFESETHRLMLAMQFLAGVNLKAIVELVERADVLGPILDPTRYRDMLFRQGGNMHDVARLARDLQPVVARFHALVEKAKEGTTR